MAKAIPTPNSVITSLLPRMREKSQEEFNVFSVMHHGTHEKQLSNVFAWLLDVDGTHGLGGLFAGLFVQEINSQLRDGPPLEADSYTVSQEVNTSAPDEAMDIADIFLLGQHTAIMVENYYTSHGHGHGHARYAAYASRSGHRPVVVMLCRSVDETLLSDGWETAAVVTYPRLLTLLVETLASRPDYASSHPDQHWFIQQMYRYFVKGLPVDADLLTFVSSMCESGEADRFRGNADVEAERLGEDLKMAAIEQFTESRNLLQRIKGHLKTVVGPALVSQLNQSIGDRYFSTVSARYQGIYQWTINISPTAVPDDVGNDTEGGPGTLQIKFGPSAWFANTRDKEWKATIADPDYGYLFLTWRRQIHQSRVSLREVAQGLADDDVRLRDEVITLIRS